MSASWRVIDYGILIDEESDEYRTITVESESQLRDTFVELSQESPRIVHLLAPGGEVLILGIGGPYSSLGWIKTPVESNCKIAIGDFNATQDSIIFQNRGSAHPIEPEQLFPLNTVLRAVSHFYVKHQLPTWIRWKVWNPHRFCWEE